MAKYHIKKDGTPGVCRAQNGNCPFGGESEHFPTKEEAQNYADKRHEAIEQRNKLAVQFIRNRSLEIERALYPTYENIDKVKDFDSDVKVLMDNGQILIQKAINVNVATNKHDKIYNNTNINIRIDPDNPSKMNVKVEREDSTWKNAVSTPLGGLRHMTAEETEILQKVENKVKNKVAKNKEQILEAWLESDNFVFNDLDQYKGKSVSDTIDGLDSERYYVIKDKDNNNLGEGRVNDGDFDDSLLSKPINNIEVKEAGSDEEMIYLYI